MRCVWTRPPMSDLSRLTAADAALEIRRGTFSATDLVRACLDRIARRDDVVRAWQVVDPDAALEQARARDREQPRGPLHGVPVGVKDVIDTADLPTTYGSKIYSQHRPRQDASAVARLRRAGAVIVGKTVTTEFAQSGPAGTVNPHDPTRSPGGSSSGSAAAVADCHVPVALGTQTAGSVVRPASFCGVFGIKPTYGLLDMGGVRRVSPSLDTLGVLARSPEDLALVTAVLRGTPTQALSGRRHRMQVSNIRLRFVRTPEWHAVDPEIRRQVLAAVSRLGHDATVEEACMPDFHRLVRAHTTIAEYEAAAQFAPEWLLHREQLSTELVASLRRGRSIPHLEYRRALEVAAACRRSSAGLFADNFLVLTMAVGETVPAVRASTGSPLYCRPWTLLHTPAVATPGLTTGDGLPLGLQVVAQPGRDLRALAAARWIEARL